MWFRSVISTCYNMFSSQIISIILMGRVLAVRKEVRTRDYTGFGDDSLMLWDVKTSDFLLHAQVTYSSSPRDSFLKINVQWFVRSAPFIYAVLCVRMSIFVKTSSATWKF